MGGVRPRIEGGREGDEGERRREGKGEAEVPREPATAKVGGVG